MKNPHWGVRAAAKPVIGNLSGVARRLGAVTDAPLSGLLTAILPDPALRGVVERAGAPLLELQGPVAARQLVVAALAADAGAGKPVLAVTATGREADELTASLGALLGHGKVADFP